MTGTAVTLSGVTTPDAPPLTPERLRESVEYAQRELSAQANPEKAEGMQWYMKTEMPFYGVQKPGRVVIVRGLVKQVEPATPKEYRELVLAFWNLPHREEKYIALALARHFDDFVTPDQLDLYRRLIVEGAWWDFVDEVATKLIRSNVAGFPTDTWSIVDPWIDDADMWLRRTAILCQIGLKEATDTDRLFAFCRARMHEKEFFIRKAIGWALREYAKTDPEAVAAFATANKEDLSGLSYREGTKHIKELLG